MVLSLAQLEAKLIAKAVPVVASLGKSVTFKVVTGATHSAATGAVSGGTTTDVVRTVTQPNPDETSFKNSDLISEGDAVLLLLEQDAAFTPELGMRVTIDGRDRLVDRVNLVFTGPTLRVFEMRVLA